MKNIFRRLLSYIRSKIRWLKSYFRIKNGATVLIRIGKCGSATVKAGIKNAKRNSVAHIVHVSKPIYRKDLKYIIVARGPISRLFSAFRWRYKLVVSERAQIDKFEGEYDVLVKYGCLNNLAEALYLKDGTPNKTAHQEIRRIHHMREDISFYLGDLLNKCRPNQIVAVLMQETLDDDVLRVFGYKNELREHNNEATGDDTELSVIGLANLKRFFSEDYAALSKLYCWGKIKREVFMDAI